MNRVTVVACLLALAASSVSERKRPRSPTREPEEEERQLKTFLVGEQPGVPVVATQEPDWDEWRRIVLSHKAEDPIEEIAAKLPWNESFSPQLKTTVVSQIFSDNNTQTAYAPSFDLPHYFAQETPMGRMILTREDMVSLTETSTIHYVPEHDVVLKFQMDCLELIYVIHPLLLDFWMIKHAEPFGLVPRTFFVSPAAHMQSGPSLKTEFRIDRLTRLACANMQANVRYGIMERVGDNLHSVMYKAPGKRVAFLEAISIGREVIDMLRRLHEEAGIIHGDIHTGNICRSKNSKFVFIDFARSKFVSETLVDKIVREPLEYNDPLLSHWETEGYAAGRRDDVFRALFALAIIMNGHKLYEFYAKIQGNVTETLALKRDSNIFISAPELNPIDRLSVPEPIKAAVALKLKEALEICNNARSVADRPDYEGIIARLDDIMRLVDV